MIIGKPDFSDLTFTINDAVFRYGAFITDVIAFVAVAAAVFFFIVKPVNAMLDPRCARRSKKGCPTRSVGTRSCSLRSPGPRTIGRASGGWPRRWQRGTEIALLVVVDLITAAWRETTRLSLQLAEAVLPTLGASARTQGLVTPTATRTSQPDVSEGREASSGSPSSSGLRAQEDEA